MKRILISPLDWGLGHATRCIPIIRYLVEKGADVVLAGEGRSAALLRREFPSLEFVDLPGYGIRYPKKGGMTLHLFLLIPGIMKGIKNEQKALQKIIKSHKIDAVISDNRYGLYSKAVPTVFICHQLFIQTPFGEKLVERIHAGFISRFEECWVPDLEGEGNLSGLLSHKNNLPGGYYFIGPLSRFSGMIPQEGPVYDLVIALSGPEPQRSILEARIREQLPAVKGRSLLVRGMTEGQEKESDGNLDIVSHLPSQAMMNVMSGAGIILGRSGYSSIMDAAVLGKKCVFVPTPGQTEQEYLMKYHEEQKHCVGSSQEMFDLSSELRKAKAIDGFEKRSYDGLVWKERIDRLIKHE
ncbi:MAG TPA: glycosyltransferase [Bacteroidia bacterium]|nr:glycosyltransferase [Bacteroidia bacterium]